jgi:hypothetical protein
LCGPVSVRKPHHSTSSTSSGSSSSSCSKIEQKSMILQRISKRFLLRFMEKNITYISNYFYVYYLINKERALSRLLTVATRLAERLRTVREKVSQPPYCHVVVWTCKGLVIALAQERNRVPSDRCATRKAAAVQRRRCALEVILVVP